MRLLGQSKLHKLLSSLALIVVIVLAVAESGYVEQAKLIILAPAPIVNTSYVINGTEIGVINEKQIYLALQSYSRNEQALEKVLSKNGVNFDQFTDSVHTVFIIDSTENRVDINVEFSSDIAASKLKPVYDHIVAELKDHILEALKKAA